MAQDLIDHYIDREGIRQDTEFVLAELNKILAELTRLANAKFSLGDAAGFRATANAAKEAQASIEALTRSQDKLIKAEIEAEKIKQARIKTENEVIKQIQLEEKAEQANIKTKKEKISYEQALQREREKGLSQSAAEAKLAEQLANEYLQLNKALRDAELRYKNLYLSGQGNTQAGKEALQTALSYRKILDEVDSKLGNFQRNVGNYASGFNGLNNSVQQILREAPSAAVSLNTFFLAISNNLPQLFDEITRAKESMQALAQAAVDASQELSRISAVQQSAAKASEQAEDALSSQVESIISTVGASKEQAAALREQITATVASGSASADAAAAAGVHAEQLALNAGASVEDAAALGVQAEAAAIAAGQSANATANLEAQTIATNEAAAAAAAQPGILKRLGSALFSVQTALTAGVLILTLYGGKIIDWIGSLFKSEKAVLSLSEKKKILNDISKEAAESFGKEAAKLEVLYSAATNVNIPLNERRKAVDEIQKQYPEYFKNVNDEIILQGKASEAYDKTRAAILENAKTRAIESQLAQIATKEMQIQLDNQDRYLRLIDAQAKNIANKAKSASNAAKGYGNTVSPEDFLAGQGAIDAINEQLDDSNKELENLAQQRDFLLSQITSAGIGNQSQAKTTAVKESTKATLDSEFEIYKIAQERKKVILQESLNDEFRSYADRISVAKEYYTESINLINAQEKENIRVQKEKLAAQEANLKKAKGTERNNLLIEIKNTNTQIKIAEAKANDERIAAGFKLFDDISDLYDKEFEETKVRYKKEAEEFNKLQERKSQIVRDRISQDANIQELETQSQFEIGIKNKTSEAIVKLERKRDQEIKKIRAEQQLTELISQEIELKQKKKYYEALNQLFGFNYFSTIAIEKQITENEIAQSKIRIDNTKNEVAEKERIRNESIDRISRYEQEAADLISTLVIAQNTREKNAIQDQIDLNEKKKNQKIDAISKEIISEEEKAAKIKIVEATAQAERERLELRQRKLDQERARFEKNLGIMQLIIQIGIALAKQQYEAAALATVALVKAIATPIPKFKHGKNNDYEGAAYVDDGGVNEPIYRADTGQIEMSTGTPQQRLTFLKKDDIVWPSMGAMMKQLVVMPKIAPIKDNEAPINDMAGVIEAIHSINIKTTSITKEGWRVQNMKLLEYQNWVNKTIKN